MILCCLKSATPITETLCCPCLSRFQCSHRQQNAREKQEAAQVNLTQQLTRSTTFVTSFTSITNCQDSRKFLNELMKSSTPRAKNSQFFLKSFGALWRAAGTPCFPWTTRAAPVGFFGTKKARIGGIRGWCHWNFRFLAPASSSISGFGLPRHTVPSCSRLNLLWVSPCVSPSGSEKRPGSRSKASNDPPCTPKLHASPWRSPVWDLMGRLFDSQPALSLVWRTIKDVTMAKPSKWSSAVKHPRMFRPFPWNCEQKSAKNQ